MKTVKLKPRIYRRITSSEVAEFKASRINRGNNTAAVRKMGHSYLAPSQRAYRLVKKSDEMSTLSFIDTQLEQIGQDAVNRLGDLVNSNDDRVASKNVHYVIDHLRGKPTQKSISLHGKIGIQDVLT